MNTERHENLDELIAEEKRLVAEEYFLEAWQAAEEDGIECDILARAFATRLLRKLTRDLGPLAADAFLDDLKRDADAGEFMSRRTIQ